MGKRRNREFETEDRRGPYSGRVSCPDPGGRRMSQTLLSGGVRESESAWGKYLLAQNPNSVRVSYRPELGYVAESDLDPSKQYRSGEDSRSRAMPMPTEGIGYGGGGYCQIQNEMVDGSTGRGVYSTSSRHNLNLEGEFNREMEMAAGHHGAYRMNEVVDPRWAHQEDMLLDLLYNKIGGAGGDLMTSSYLTPTIVERGVGGNARAQENQYHDDALPSSYHSITEPTVPSYDQLLASSNSTTDAIWNRDTRGLGVEPLSYQDTHLQEDDQSLLDAYGGSRRRLEEAKDLACLTPLKRWALKKKEQLTGNHSKSKFFHPLTSCLGVPNYGDHLLNTEDMEQSAVEDIEQYANYGEDEWNNTPNVTFGGDQINSGQGLMPREDQRNNDNRVTNCAEPQWRAYQEVNYGENQWNAEVMEKLNADRLLPGLPGSMQEHYGKQSKSARVHVKERLGPLRSSVKMRLGPANSHGRVKSRLGPAQIDPDLNISGKTDDYSGSSHPQRFCLPKVKKDALTGSIYPQGSARAQFELDDFSGSIHPQRGGPKKVKTDAVTGTIQTDAVTGTIHPLKVGPKKNKIDAVTGKCGLKKVKTDADAVTVTVTGSIITRKAGPKKVKIDAITGSTHPPGSVLQQVKPDDFSGSIHPTGLPDVKIDAANGSNPPQVKRDDSSGSIHPQKVGRRKLKRDAVTGSTHPQGSVLPQVKTDSFDGSIHPEGGGLPKPKTDGGIHPEGSALPNVKTNDFSGSIHPQRVGLPEVKIDAASGSTHSQESAPPQVKPYDSSGSVYLQRDGLPEVKIDAAIGSTQSQGTAAPQVKPDDFIGSIHPQRAGLPVKIDAGTGSTHSHSQGNAPPQVKPDDFSECIHPQRVGLPEVKIDAGTGSTHSHSQGNAPPQLKPDDFSESIHPQRAGLPEVKIDAATGSTHSHSQGNAPPQVKPDDFSERIHPQRADLPEVKIDAATGSTHSPGSAPPQFKPDDFSGSIHPQRVGLPEVKIDTGSTLSQGSAPPQVKPDDFSGSIHPTKASDRELMRDAVTGSNHPQRAAGLAEVKIDAAIRSTHSQGSAPLQVQPDDFSGSVHPQRVGLPEVKIDTRSTHSQGSAPPQVKPDDFSGSIHPTKASHRKLMRDVVTGSNHPQRAAGLTEVKIDAAIRSTHSQGSAPLQVQPDDFSGSVHLQRVGLPAVKIDTGSTHSQGSASPQVQPDDFSGSVHGLAEVKIDAAIRSSHSQGSAPPQVKPDDFSGIIHPTKAGRRKLKRDAVTGSNDPQRAGLAEVKIDTAIGSTHSQGRVPPQVKLDDSSGSIHPQKAGLRKLKRDAFTGISHPQVSVKTDNFDGSIHPEDGGLSKLETDGGIHPEGSALPNVKTNDISGSIGPQGDCLSKWMRKGAEKTSPEETEEFKKLVDTEFLKFVNILVENPNQMKKGQCCVCASSEEFVGTEPLAIHAFMSPMVGLRADHLGFHRAVCVLLGWDSTAVLNCMWVPRSLPTAEALALKEDLVIWPPVVVIHNSSMSNKCSEDERLMLNVEELEDILTDIGFGRETCKVYRGKPADVSIMVAKFNPTFPGLLEAERLQSFFVDNQHGKAEWQTFSSAKEALLADKEHVLYGYLGTAEDWGKLDLEGMKRLVVKSKKEMKAIANASI